MRSTSLAFIFIGLLLSSCIKEAGKIAPADALSDSDGTTTGGTSGGSSPTPDPLAQYAWHLDNTGQNSFSTGNGIAGEDISLAEAIEEGFTGEGVRIAISDSGADILHEDLTGNELTGEHRNYVNLNPANWHGANPSLTSSDHGTAVAGLAAAEGWNGKGSRGVAPDANFAAFVFITTYPSSVDTESYLTRLVDQTSGNFDIFNYSYGYGQCAYLEADELILEAFEEGTTSLRSGKGAIYIQSSGNSYVDYLENCLGVAVPGTFIGNTNHSDDLAFAEKIIVGAVNANGEKSSYSTPGSGIWVSSPGGESGRTAPGMITTDITGCNHGYSYTNYAYNSFNRGGTSSNSKCSYTSYMNGTSSAAPVLSGVVALMLQANPALSWRDVKHILALTADEIDYSLFDELYHPTGGDFFGHTYDWKWVRNAAGIDFSNWYGFGRVNALSAVLMANTYSFPLGAYEKTSAPSSGEWYYDSGEISLPIPDADANGVSSNLEVRHNFFIESVQIQFSTDHTNPSDLGIILISPSGTESRLIHINSNTYEVSMHENKLLLTNAFYGEESAGTWTLKVVDANDEAEGNITNWKIRINGHRISGDGSFPNAVTNLTHVNNYPSPNYTPPISFTASTSVDVMRYEISIGTASGLSDIAEWTSVGTSTSNIQLSNLRLTN